jgi:hypothetical protein
MLLLSVCLVIIPAAKLLLSSLIGCYPIYVTTVSLTWALSQLLSYFCQQNLGIVLTTNILLSALPGYYLSYQASSVSITWVLPWLLSFNCLHYLGFIPFAKLLLFTLPGCSQLLSLLMSALPGHGPPIPRYFHQHLPEHWPSKKLLLSTLP